ncbi:hypothetical protein ACOSQ3_030931 [Xanthoceras sorbifolium]
MNMLAELKFKKKSFIWRIRYISVNRLFGAFRFLVRFGCLFGNYAMELFPRNQRSPSADSALWFLSTVAPSLATATAYIPSRHRRSSPLSALCVGDYVGKQGGANYSTQFKNLEKLVKSLDTEILAKLHGSSKPFSSTLRWLGIHFFGHSQFLNMFFPDKAETLAFDILKELIYIFHLVINELKVKPCPVVFASFSGGPKACMYKVLQMTEGIISLPYKQRRLALTQMLLLKPEVGYYCCYSCERFDFVEDVGGDLQFLGSVKEGKQFHGLLRKFEFDGMMKMKGTISL